MMEIHALDKLCIASRVRYATNFTDVVKLDECWDLQHLCQELYKTAAQHLSDTGPLHDKGLMWYFTIDISDDPTVTPTRLTMQIPGEVFHESANVVVPCLMRTMRDIYDGQFGRDKVQMGGAPLVSWEDLL